MYKNLNHPKFPSKKVTIFRLTQPVSAPHDPSSSHPQPPPPVPHRPSSHHQPHPTTNPIPTPTPPHPPSIRPWRYYVSSSSPSSPPPPQPQPSLKFTPSTPAVTLQTNRVISSFVLIPLAPPKLSIFSLGLMVLPIPSPHSRATVP